MMENNKHVEEMLKNYLEINSIIKELEDLKKEKQEIVNLMESGNPPADILEKMTQNEENYKKLLKKSEILVKNTEKLKQYIINNN